MGYFSRLEKEDGPAHERKFVCSVQVETAKGNFVTIGDPMSRVKDSENSAAQKMLEVILKFWFLFCTCLVCISWHLVIFLTWVHQQPRFCGLLLINVIICYTWAIAWSHDPWKMDFGQNGPKPPVSHGWTIKQRALTTWQFSCVLLFLRSIPVFLIISWLLIREVTKTELACDTLYFSFARALLLQEWILMNILNISFEYYESEHKCLRLFDMRQPLITNLDIWSVSSFWGVWRWRHVPGHSTQGWIE